MVSNTKITAVSPAQTGLHNVYVTGPTGTSVAVLGLLIILVAVVLGGFWAPAMAQLSDVADDYKIEQGLAAALMNLAWAAGQIVGGDWYDLITLPAGRSGVIVGDVMGHGPEAAAVMAQLRAAAHALGATGVVRLDKSERARAPRRTRSAPRACR